MHGGIGMGTVYVNRGKLERDEMEVTLGAIDNCKRFQVDYSMCAADCSTIKEAPCVEDQRVEDFQSKQFSAVQVTENMEQISSMAPELLLCLCFGCKCSQTRRRLTPASDMWSIGCLLYTFLIGFPPFCEDSITATILR